MTLIGQEQTDEWTWHMKFEGTGTANSFRWGNSLAMASGFAWAYTSYQYNWLNVGGGQSKFMEFWIYASGVVPYMAICVWLIALALVVISDWRRSLPALSRACRGAVTLLMMPIIFLIADWFFHLGFPKSPV